MSIFRPTRRSYTAEDVLTAAQRLRTGSSNAGQLVTRDTVNAMPAVWRCKHLLADIVAGLRKIKKTADEKRKTHKEPLQAQIDVMAARFNIIVDAVDKKIAILLALANDYRTKLQAKLDAERAAREAAAAQAAAVPVALLCGRPVLEALERSAILNAGSEDGPWFYRLAGILSGEPQLELIPAPIVDTQIEYYFVPTPTILSADGDLLHCLPGWDAWVTYDTTIQVLGAEETDVSVWVGMRDQVWQREIIPATKSRAYYVLVVDDPMVIFEVQGSGTITAAKVQWGTTPQLTGAGDPDTGAPPPQAYRKIFKAETDINGTATITQYTTGSQQAFVVVSDYACATMSKNVYWLP